MKYPILDLIYYCEDKKIKSQRPENSDYKITYEVTEKSIKAFLTAKKNIILKDFSMSFDKKYKSDVKVFSNGYQSWSLSREYGRDDKMPSLNPLEKGRLKLLSGLSSDCRFVNLPSRRGEFYSHTYTYIKHSDHILLIGSLCEKTGFTIFYHDMNKNVFLIDKDVEGVELSEGNQYEIMNVVIIKGEYNEAFDEYFKMMNIKKPSIDHMAGYTSWYNYFQNITEDIVLRDLNALDEIKECVNVFQIDDGYETYVGDWLDLNEEKFPHTMKYMADKIHEKGYLAGIWLAPFNVEKKSRIFNEHSDWLVKDESGKPMLSVFNWSGAYTLDIYNEEACNYIQNCIETITDEWGYDMLKLDFLYSQCIYPRNGKSRGEIMDDAMKLIRKWCKNTIILGCGVPIGSSFGYVDACRVSCDADLKYSGKYYNKLHIANELPSVRNAVISTIFRRHLDGRAFCSDPDVFFFRTNNIEFNEKQKILLATINHLFGNVLFVSDNVSEYNDYFKSLIKKVFVKSDFRIVSAEFVNNNIIQVVMSKNGKEKLLRFNIKTGENNLKI